MIAPPANPAPTPSADHAPAPPTDPPLPTLTPLELQIALTTLTDPSTPPLAHAACLEIHPADFLQTLARPHVQQWIQAALGAEALQHQIVDDRARTAALDILTQLASDPEVPPIERRRAASAILRSFSRSVPRPPRAPSSPAAPRFPRQTRADDRGEAESDDEHAIADGQLRSGGIDEARRLGELRRTDAAAVRARYDFSTSDDAAVSVTQILTGADPDDPEAAFTALALVTRDMLLHMEEFVQEHRPIHHAAGAAPIALQHVGHEWYQLSLQPRQTEAEPLEIRFQIWPARRKDHFEIVELEPCDDPLPWASSIPSRPIPLPADRVPLTRPEITPFPAPSTTARHTHAHATDDDDRPP